MTAVPREEVAGAAGVLAEDEARVAKGREGPRREVFEVSDGGGDDEEAPGGAGWRRSRERCYQRDRGPGAPWRPGVVRSRRCGSSSPRFSSPRLPDGAGAAETPVPTTGPAQTLDRIAAVVGDEVVLEGEISRLAAIGFLPRRKGEAELAYRDRLLDLRVVELLREKELRLLTGLEPDPAEVNAKLDEVAARYEAGAGEPFDRVLDRARTNRDEVQGLDPARHRPRELRPREAPADGEGDGRGDAGVLRRAVPDRGRGARRRGRSRRFPRCRTRFASCCANVC